MKKCDILKMCIYDFYHNQVKYKQLYNKHIYINNFVFPIDL